MEEGILKSNKASNTDIIKNHRKSRIHNVAIEEFKRVKRARLSNEINSMLKDEYPWTITNRHMR